MAEWYGFYSTSQVSRLARVPVRTLYDWKAKGIISPSVQVIGPGGVEDEGYSYADLAIIKLMRGLRDKRLNLRSVAESLRHLYERFGAPTSPGWQQAHVYISGREVYARRPDEWDTTVATRYGQKTMKEFVVGELFEEDAALLVPRSFADYVEIDPNVMDGVPVIKNTRVPTSMMSMLVDQGATLAELEELYSPICRDYLWKAFEFERSLDQTNERVPA